MFLIAMLFTTTQPPATLARGAVSMKGSGRVVVLVTVAAGLIMSAPYRVSHSGLRVLR